MCAGWRAKVGGGSGFLLYLSEFSTKFANDKWAAFPTPIDGYVTRNVLIETLMEGSSIANFMRMKVQFSFGFLDSVVIASSYCNYDFFSII